MTDFSLVLHTAFLFWPVKCVQESDGWFYGQSETLHTLGHRALLQKGRLDRRHHRQPLKGEQRSEIEVTESEVTQSFLWHENLGAALEAQKVLYETELLDENRYSEPQALVHGDKAKKALIRFINLHSGKTSEALEFVREFGIFDLPDERTTSSAQTVYPRAVREYFEKCSRQREDPFATRLDMFWEVQKDVLGLWRFADALAERNQDSIREECKRRRPDFDFGGEPDWKSIGKAILAADLSHSLNRSSPIPPRILLHDREGQFIALTVSRSVRSAMYLQLLVAIVSKYKHRSCLRCRGYFIPETESQKYCSRKCQNAAKVKRFRDKSKKLKSKFRKPQPNQARRAGAPAPTGR